VAIISSKVKVDKLRLKQTKGQTMVEYGLLIALVGLSTIVLLSLMSDSIKDSYDRIITAIVNATS
jgi:Flp pilus assembly pilin Flp